MSIKEVEEEITERDVMEYLVKETSEEFAKYFYKTRFHRKFVVNDHHKIIWDTLDKVIRGEITKLILCLPPRFSKTELAVKNFIAHGLAVNPASKFIHLSYSDDLAKDNSEQARDIVSLPEYKELFPYVRVRHDSDSKKKWYTTAGGGVYATAAGGAVTGFGAGEVDLPPEELEELYRLQAEEEGISFDEFLPDPKDGFAGAVILDDALKPEDAESEVKRKRVNDRWTSTISNRVNSRRTPFIVMGHRLHPNDLAGHLIETDGIYDAVTNPGGWIVVSISAIVDYGLPTERALWPFKHTLKELKKMEETDPISFGRQYMQNPKPAKGLLYKSFKTYKVLPHDARRKKSVTDTADEGTDYLCKIIYSPTTYGYFLLDVYYTQDGMETTEEEAAARDCQYDVEKDVIESNNGGRSFARNVEKICRQRRNHRTEFKWFHQSKNKDARIKTNAATVQNMIYYPEDWETRWPKFAIHVKAFQANMQNATDDPEDALTMIIEEEFADEGSGMTREN